MPKLFKVICFFILFVFSNNVVAQYVEDVKYWIKYDTSSCLYDCHIIIENGSATGVGFRTLIGASYNVVVPAGSPISIAETYMPLKNNQNYTGTDPISWNIGPSAYDIQGLDIHRIYPTTIPSAQFNNISEGDTIKLFSLDVTNLDSCGVGVRNYINGVDPNYIDGGDYDNGITIGPFAVYNGNFDAEYSTGIDVALNNMEINGFIQIDIDVLGSACQGGESCIWSGPNGFSSINEDVLIDPVSSADYGLFDVIVTDSIGCLDTFEILVEEPASSQLPTNEVIIDGIKVNPTYEHIAIHVDIIGDDNLNSEMTIEFKPKGTDIYMPSSQVMRGSPGLIVLGAPLAMNFHAGSAMHLMPNSYYDVKITLSDIDGGSTVVDTTILTSRFPTYAEANQNVYVIPGAGGGDGSQGNPYLGIQDAMNNVAPGQVILLADGVYPQFSMTESGTIDQPIIIKSTNLHGAIIDGSNTSGGVITVGTFSDSIQHIIIDGLEIKNGAWGIDAQNTQYVSVINNKINDVDFGFYNRRENGWEHDQYIHNNEIIGRTSWPQLNGEIPGERGVDIRGNRNVISYNTISDFGDGISTDGPPYKVSYALDIHHNDITRVVDDIIEVDGVISNTRVYNNRGYNGRMGVSVAPVYGGPAYIFRNEFYNLETSGLKMNREPSGLFVVNNTIIKLDRGLTSSSGWQNTVFKNNIIMSGHYTMEEYELVSGSNDDWNNNGYYSLRAGTNAEPWFKFDNIKYADVAAINASGILESNGIAIAPGDLVTVVMPTSYGTEADPSNVDVSIVNNSSLINAGQSINNLLDGSISGLPDIGAVENGMIFPDYGHDFGGVCSSQNQALKTWNGEVHMGWFHPDNWSPCGVPVDSSKVIIPAGALHYPFLNSNVIIGDMDVLNNATIELTKGVEFKLSNQ